ncbi:hypothetical protein DL93DRAFT_1763656 [Clavulina sp. PMI_390]|nr:hypothetical protein DL93DRAFT_1763656 [Clavulina sp. PMI_390]
MKVIITGASGFAGSELIRQALLRPEITSIIAVSRKPVSAPGDASEADAAKVKSVVVDDYDVYPDDVKKEFAGAAACIWTVTITCPNSKSFTHQELVRVCQTSTVVGLLAMVEAQPTKPFRFLYMSGMAAERDQTKTPALEPEYALLRGEAENKLLQCASELDNIKILVTRPGFITAPDRPVPPPAAEILRGKTIDVSELAKVMLELVLVGSDKDPLWTADLMEVAERLNKA